MVGIVKEIDGQKKIVPLTTDTGTGAPVGTLVSQYKKVPMSGYLYCDGSTFDENDYPALYMYLGTNVLPDYRECVMVGAEQNTTDTIATHDVYTQGEFKDDQLQEHEHNVYIGNDTRLPQIPNSTAGIGNQLRAFNNNGSGNDIHIKDIVNARPGETTHGKQKAVYVYIKATSGLAENQQENVLNDVKGYVDNSNSYSTQEVKTGGTWIDGKPIYRKVITHTLSDALTGLVEIQHNIQNIDLPIRIVFGKATVPGSSNSVTIPSQHDSTTFIQLGVFNDIYVQLFAGSTNWISLKEITLCLEYTKKTDW